MAESSLCFQEWNRNSGHRCLYKSLPEIVGKLLYSSLHPSSGADEVSGSPGSLALLYMMKVMVLHFVSGFHKVTAAGVVVFLQIVVVEAFCAIS